jgi:two-component system, OmpR family, response regulator
MITNHKGCILLVEDSDDQARLIERWLQRCGFSVHIASDGALGLELARRGEFDLVIAGIDLPFYRGIEIVGWSKAEHPSRPVLLLTASSILSESEQRAANMADAFFTKPLKRAPFCDAVLHLHTDALGRRSDAASLREFADAGVGAEAGRHSGVTHTLRVPVGYVISFCDASTARPPTW